MGGELSPTVAVWLGLAALPLVLALATAFTKATVVLGSLRLALGAETLLPWSALLAVAVIVTAVVMGPTASEIWAVVEARGGLGAVMSGDPSTWIDVLQPLIAFVTRHASPDEIEFFADLQNRPAASPLVIVPAFLVTELTEALAMAVVILVPLVLVDLLVAQVLVLVGLVNQPTAMISIPLKLVLFLGIGGWDVVIGGLVEGYA
jgi:flagellar biosynthetic protein FliP